MAASIPGADVLLQAASNYLESELLPTLEGYHRFQTRVTVNVLQIVLRQLRHGADNDAAESQGLSELLGHSGEVAALNRELAEGIREGRFPITDERLVAHLRGCLQAALAVNNPKWLDDSRSAPP